MKPLVLILLLLGCQAQQPGSFGFIASLQDHPDLYVQGVWIVQPLLRSDTSIRVPLAEKAIAEYGFRLKKPLQKSTDSIDVFPWRRGPRSVIRFDSNYNFSDPTGLIVGGDGLYLATKNEVIITGPRGPKEFWAHEIYKGKATVPSHFLLRWRGDITDTAKSKTQILLIPPDRNVAAEIEGVARRMYQLDSLFLAHRP